MATAATFVADSGPEGQLVELPALHALCGDPGRVGAGWIYVHGPELAPDAPVAERKLWSDVVLVERFRAAVARINPHLPPEAVRAVCDLGLTSTSPAVVEDHRGFHEFLLAGVPVGYLDEHGEERHDYARLVDFDEIGNNEFLAVNQLRSSSARRTGGRTSSCT
jgi:type I site-specific restriction-modification system R (restriction) subunit